MRINLQGESLFKIKGDSWKSIINTATSNQIGITQLNGEKN